ncbi:hypothetical protein [Peribacillus muralis]|uniref:hypothetical protein n=1 Tax=Peribacillus muralis TaxID=264697 RepID=UPI003D06B963
MEYNKPGNKKISDFKEMKDRIFREASQSLRLVNGTNLDARTERTETLTPAGLAARDLKIILKYENEKTGLKSRFTLKVFLLPKNEACRTC